MAVLFKSVPGYLSQIANTDKQQNSFTIDHQCVKMTFF